jgi:hypothetical protein
MIQIEKSLKRGRLVYYFNFWDRFFSLLIPSFLVILLLCIGYWSLEIGIRKGKTASIIYSSLFLILILLPIVGYLFINKLSTFKGKSRSNNLNLVREFAKQKGYSIDNETNELCSIEVEVRFFSYHNTRWLTVLYENDLIHYNCTTFENINTPDIQIMNFKSPFSWFSNKKHERKLRNFMKSQLEPY